MIDHPDIEKLDLSVRETVRGVFRDPENGTPDDISKAGCLALAEQGFEAWNAWRAIYPVRRIKNNYPKNIRNNADFSNVAIKGHIEFSNFDFGDYANFYKTQFIKDNRNNSNRRVGFSPPPRTNHITTHRQKTVG